MPNHEVKLPFTAPIAREEIAEMARSLEAEQSVAVRAELIERLRRQVEAGTYRIPAEQLAEAVLDAAIRD